MHFKRGLALLAAASATALPLAHRAPPTTCGTKPPAFFLAGDSTTAPGGGWGNGFVPLLTNGAKGTNHASNGKTTVSFVSGGYWAKVIAGVKAAVTSNYTPYVTIQFGHNDQKSGAGISLAQFQSNLEKLAKEVVAAGGTPILVTPLTRRTFSGNAVVENLQDQRAATIAAATATGSAWIDLNAASTAYVNAIGKANAALYNLAASDYTHLNARGQGVFARMVADLLLGHAASISSPSFTPSGCFVEYLTGNSDLTSKIWSGQPA